MTRCVRSACLHWRKCLVLEALFEGAKLGKSAPWRQYPERMLQMRAGWCIRDLYADVEEAGE